MCSINYIQIRWACYHWIQITKKNYVIPGAMSGLHTPLPDTDVYNKTELCIPGAMSRLHTTLPDRDVYSFPFI